MTGVHLPGGSQPTSALGFGCSSLSAGSSRRHSIRLVHAACDAGIRHFDVAPPYGMGTAEDVLGEALQGRRQSVTLATKVGKARPEQGRLIMLARSLAAPLRKLVPGLTRSVGASVYKGVSTPANLDLQFVEASLTESLRRLKTDTLDLLLLHEVTLEKLTDEVLRFLESLRQRGLVRALGTGTSYENTLAIRAAHLEFFDVWQYSWSVLDREQERPVEFTITHRAVQRALAPLRERLGRDTAAMRRLCEATGIDLAARDNLGEVLIGAALANNPGGITLVASRQESRIVANARLLSERRFVDAGQQLIRALAGEPDLVRS